MNNKLKVMAATILLATSTYCLTGCKTGTIADYSDAEILEEYERRHLEQKTILEQNDMITEDDILYLPGQHYVTSKNLDYHEGYELAAAYKSYKLSPEYIYVNTTPVIVKNEYEFGKVIELENVDSKEIVK